MISSMGWINLVLGSGLGLLAGVFTGLIPGIHMNLIATFLAFESASVMGKPMIFIPFLIALSVAYCFFEYIPTIFLSAPKESSALLVRPTHKFLKQGRGLEVLDIILKSSLVAILMFLVSLPLLIYLLPAGYKAIGNYTWVFLLAISLHFILKEKHLKQIFWTLVVFGASGVLGWIVLNSYASFKLMPLLTGLFGAPFLIKNLENQNSIPKQLKGVKTSLGKKDLLFGNFLGMLATFLLGIFPGLGPAQASMLANEAREEKNPRDFFVTMGAINLNDILFSVLALFTIKKPRAGTIAAIRDLFSFSKTYFFISILIAFLVAIVSYFLAKKTGKIFANKIQVLTDSKFILVVLLFLFSITFFLDGFYGILILITGSLIGYLALEKGIRQSHAMAALIVPTILYFL